MKDAARLQFYNRDKGRKTLNLTEKYKTRVLATKKK